ADECVRDIERRIAAVRGRVGGRPAPRVLALEWLEPPFVPGHWVPEMIALAGAVPLRGTARRPSYALPWTALADLDPDVLLVMPCGFDLARARAEADHYASALRRVALVTTVTAEYERISMHGVRRGLLHQQAQALGLPLEEVLISPRASNEEYEGKMEAALAAARARFPGLDAVVFGDLFLADIRAYRV